MRQKEEDDNKCRRQKRLFRQGYREQVKEAKKDLEVSKDIKNLKKNELREHKLNILDHVKFHEQMKPKSTSSSSSEPKRTNLVRQHARYFDSWE